VKHYPGVVVGIVKSLDDPDGQGRVQVEFPWLSDNQKSAWAPIATLMAGKQRGMMFMPELDDELLVAFEHGDFEHPFIIGFLWNGVDEPPHQGINHKVRRLKTVSGHTVDFDDNTGQEKITIKTAGGHEIEMKDAPTGHIAVKTKGGQEVTMNDVPPDIEIKISSQNSIKISNTGIDISAPAGNLSVNCLQANVTAASMMKIDAPMMTINAPMTIFNGIVQVPTLIAQAVVGSAYTPAPGNTFGL
jgi:uncharacterized protein involved in type VI secretion and phage assembly